jgi:3-deoxy-D-manno-octulosonate 8-phosphate phosphatase KdsC-like HAD superfamily phosphatase
VDWVSQFSGGRGAARELVELILRAQGAWDAIVASYEHEARSVEGAR